MIEKLIRILFVNFNVVLLIAAIVAACISWGLVHKRQPSFVNTLFGWLLLLSIGGQGVYTFIVHVFFPAVSAANNGWAVSPFQYEVGIADLTVGVLGVLGFWGDYSFRLAAAIAAIVWYWGDAIGHIRQMIVAKNFAPGNAGSWFWTDVLVPILLIVCLAIVWRQNKEGTS